MNERGLVWMHGRVVPAERATVSALDRGFLLGDGLFETMRALGRRVLRLERHLARLRSGAERVGIACPAGIGEAVAELLAAAADVEERAELAVRLTLSRGESRDGLMPDLATPPTLTVWVHPLSAAVVAARERGLRLYTASHRLSSRSVLAGVKTLGYVAQVCALVEARAAGADDALLLDERDRIGEGSASNVFWVSAEGALRTSSSSCGILPGLTRGEILDLARDGGLVVEEGEWPLEDLAHAREAFATSTVRGIVAIVDLDGSSIGDGAVGPVTRRLKHAWDARVAAEMAGVR